MKVFGISVVALLVVLAAGGEPSAATCSDIAEYCSDYAHYYAIIANNPAFAEQPKESDVRNVVDMARGSGDPKVAAVDHALGQVLFKYGVAEPDFARETCMSVCSADPTIATLGARLNAYLMAKQKEAQGPELR